MSICNRLRRALPSLLLLVLVGCGGHRSHSSAGTAHPSSSAPPLPRLDTVRARQLQTDLSAGRLGDLHDGLALPSGATLSPTVLSQLRGLAPIQFDLASYRQTGPSSASVTATTAKGRWIVDLICTQGRWMVAATEPAA